MYNNINIASLFITEGPKLAIKRDKFVQLAEKRVNNTLNNLRLIGNLSSKASYEYAQRDVDQIFRALSKALAETKSKFQSGGEGGGSTFRLNDE